MSDLFSAENLRLFLLYAVPGIIIVYTRGQFLTGRMPTLSDGIATYLTVSLTYHALAFPIVPSAYLSEERVLHTFGWFIFVFLAPSSVGMVLGLNAKMGWTASLLSRVGVNTIHPMDCAWDWRFSNCPESWVLIVLKNGTRWAGVLGTESFISSNPSERDLYLQRVYRIADDNTWSENSSSVWLAHGEIQSVEMWPKLKEDGHGEGKHKRARFFRFPRKLEANSER